jgi:hypothetical protein
MSRYEEKYWDAGPILHTPFDDEEYYGCEITDTETGLVGKTHRARSSKTKAYNDAWEDLMQKQKDYYSTPKTKYVESPSESTSYTSSPSDYSGCITPIAWIVGIGVALFVVVWLAVNVVLPVALLNSALVFTILIFVFKRYKTLFAALALVGCAYMLLDISYGWLSVNFVEKVVKNTNWISGFVYINAIAVGISIWILTSPIWEKAKRSETEKGKSYLIKGLVILLITIGIISAPIFYRVVQNPSNNYPKTNLSPINSVNNNQPNEKPVAQVNAKNQLQTTTITKQLKKEDSWPIFWTTFSNAVNQENLNVLQSLSQPDESEFKSNEMIGASAREYVHRKLEISDWENLQNSVKKGFKQINDTKKSTYDEYCVFVYRNNTWYFYGIIAE